MRESAPGDRPRQAPPAARLITGRRTAWPFALLPLVLGILLIGLGQADRQPVPNEQLPDGYDSSEAALLTAELSEGEASAAITLWTADEGRLTPEQLGAIKQVVGDGPFIPSEDGTAVYTVAPVQADTSEDARDVVKELRSDVADSAPEGTTALVTGPAAIQADLSEVFAGADLRLLAATATVVAILLIITYRSPILWIIPLAVVGIADRLAAVVTTHVMNRIDLVQWDPSVVGILSVLVFGAGTNYALLLISRYRDELKQHESRHEAMARALARTAEPVLFSASTVVLGALTLLLSLIPTTRGIGFACALGIVIAAFYALVALPATLVLFGRWVFWPKAPKVGDALLVDSFGFWHKVGTRVQARPKTFAAVTVVALLVLMSGATQMQSGLRQADQFLETPDAVVAAERLAESYPAGTSDPLQVLTRDDAEQVLAAAQEVDGVASATLGAQRDGLAMVEVVVADEPTSDAGIQTVRDLRERLDDFDDTYVTGGEAVVIDESDAADRDRMLIIPAVLLLVLFGLGLLLRSIVAPLILVATVVTTYATALGVSWWIFDLVFGFPAVAQQVPLLAFLFLVALGVDYNIFLVTRAREEARTYGTRTGMIRALTATGGVITSAGILLAAVFAVLGVLPLVFLAQIGIIIFVGVLFDTLVVRTVLVPALAISLGDRFWWPRTPPGEAGTGAGTDGGGPGEQPASDLVGATAGRAPTVEG